MSRRSKRGRSNSNKQNIVPILIGVAIALVAVAAIVIVPKLINKEEDVTFNVKEFIQNSSDYVGNTGSFIGTIKGREKSEIKGEIVLIVEASGKEPGDPAVGRVLVLVSEEVKNKFPQINLTNESSYRFKVKVDSKTLINAVELHTK